MKLWYGDPDTLENLIILLVFGVVIGASNITILIVWLSAQFRSSVTIHLSLIAIYDLLTILAGTVWSAMGYVVGNLRYGDDCYVQTITANLVAIFHGLSIFSTTFLAIQRFTICVFPFYGPRLCKMKSVIVHAVVSIVIIMLWRLPYVMINDVTRVTLATKNNETMSYCDVVHVLDEETAQKAHQIDPMIRLIFYQIVPEVIVTICMTGCVVTVNRRTMVTSQSRKRTTLMLSLVMLLFIVGELPSTIMEIYYAFYPQVDAWIVSSSGIMFAIAVLLVSYSLNIWVYVVMSQQFRDALMNIICRRRKHAKSTNNTTEENDASACRHIAE